MIFNNILETIGNTPLVKIMGFRDDNMADIYAKLEFFNPGGSVKDRPALNMIREMEEKGLINKDSKLIEATSGNTGIGIAMIGAALGYSVTIVMPETMSIERRMLMKAYGANLVLTEGKLGMKGAISKAESMVNDEDYVMISQFKNIGNPNSHMISTAKEIIRDLDSVDAFVAGVGTGGTITGVGKILKGSFSNVEIIAVEPQESAVLSGGEPSPHKIQGIGAGFIPEILDVDIIDKIETISGDDAFYYARKCAVEEGILLGISGGAAFAAAVRTAKRIGSGKNVVFIAPDNGERYLSMGLYE